jgi:hypothetical protein
MPPRRVIAVTLLMAVTLAACATTSTSRSPEERNALIAQLEAARRTDQQNALSPEVGPVAQGDLMVSAGYTEDVIGKLRRDEYVSQHEIDRALVVPPTTLTAAQRADFIRQLEAARKMDQVGVEDYTREPDKTEDYLVQMKMIDRTTQQLRRGDPVSWWAIQQALQVPQNP